MSTLAVLFLVWWCVLLVNVEASLPQVSPAAVVSLETFGEVPDHGDNTQRAPLMKSFNRLPGVCRRLRRRRISILCNMVRFCSMMDGHQHGQICRCPRQSKCSHFFLRSM